MFGDVGPSHSEIEQERETGETEKDTEREREKDTPREGGSE